MVAKEMGMPRIVWLDQGEQVKETVVPTTGFMGLGRSDDNHIILSDPRVSRHHARLLCGPHGCLLKDLSNSRSIQVNGNPVHSRFLQDGDIIRIGNHVLEFLADERKQDPAPDHVSQTPTYPVTSDLAPLARQAWKASKQRAFLCYTAGPAKGHIQTVDRPLLPIGEPDGYYAAVSQRTSGFYLLNLGKGLNVHLNEKPVHGAGALLTHGDIIGMGDEQIEMRIFEHTEH